MSNPATDPAGAAAQARQHALQSETLQLLRRLLLVAGELTPAVARRAGLSATELSALEHLLRAPVGPADLARLLHVTSAASSGIVDRLEGRGHLVREPDPDDGRRTRLVVTESAREEVVGHLAPMFVRLAQLDAELSAEERAVVDRFLGGAIAAVSALL